jgi:GntR family transcriptional regulator/MocR family aminotransferase
MEPLLPFALELPRAGSRRLLEACHRQLRQAILDGRLAPGTRLPASRALAASLGVSRNTVTAAYDLLLAEGYLAARRGSGTYVADFAQKAGKPRSAAVIRGQPARAPVEAAVASDAGPEMRLAPAWRGAQAGAGEGAATTPASPRFDFSVGLPDKSLFPFETWRRLSARALRRLSKAPAAYAPAGGRGALREAIAGHVSFTRAVACGGDDVIVTNGAQQAFDLLARVLVHPGRNVVALEDPGYPPLRAAFAAAGARIVGVPTDAQGLRVDLLPRDAAVICVTPSHQFPLGPALSLARRAALLSFARDRNAVVIEDDYDGEFRHGGRPLDALQTLDRDGRVFYVGTFSKSLFPALRLGFVISPPWARAALTAAHRAADWHSPVLAQDTLAEFIAEGHLARHVRKMRKVYGSRRAALLRALASRFPDTLMPWPSDAGLHIAARLAGGLPARLLAAQAIKEGIGVMSLSHFALGAHALDGRAEGGGAGLRGDAAQPAPNGMVFGFGMIDEARIEPAVMALARVYGRLVAG